MVETITLTKGQKAHLKKRTKENQNYRTCQDKNCNRVFLCDYYTHKDNYCSTACREKNRKTK